MPGTVDGWFALHGKFGKLPMTEDLAPAIAYATNGFPVTELIAQYWQDNMAAFEQRQGTDRGARQRARTPISLLTPMAAIRRRKAKSSAIPISPTPCRMIATGGRDAFYKGAIAHTIDAYFKRIGGDLRYEDFADSSRRMGDAALGQLSRL